MNRRDAYASDWAGGTLIADPPAFGLMALVIGCRRIGDCTQQSDLLLISAPLTPATYGLIGSAELRRMKDDAILVNLARGDVEDSH